MKKLENYTPKPFGRPAKMRMTKEIVALIEQGTPLSFEKDEISRMAVYKYFNRLGKKVSIDMLPNGGMVAYIRIK